MRGQLIECVCYGRPNKLDFFPLVTYWNGVFSNGCCPHLTRPTYTLISKTCSALRSQLLCSSWCHLNLVPAGLSGVDKTPLPDNTPPLHWSSAGKKKGGLLLWRWITQPVTLVPSPPKPRWSANAIKAINLQQKGFTAASYEFAPFRTGA